MNGRTAKLLRKTSGGDPAKYKLVKKAWPQLPAPMRHQGKLMMQDIIEVERQHLEMQKLGITPQDMPAIGHMPMPGPQ